jgi:hypothetical protein
LSKASNKDCNSNSGSGFFSLSPCELTLLATTVSFAIAESLDEAQRALLGNFLETVGINLINLTPGAWNV